MAWVFILCFSLPTTRGVKVISFCPENARFGAKVPAGLNVLSLLGLPPWTIIAPAWAKKKPGSDEPGCRLQGRYAAARERPSRRRKKPPTSPFSQTTRRGTAVKMDE